VAEIDEVPDTAEYIKARFGLAADPEWVQDPKTKDWVLFGPTGAIRAEKSADRMPGSGAPGEGGSH
jgi:hypothetical protein